MTEMLGPSARLISVSDPLDFDTAEDLISYVARVSNPANQTNFETSGKLLKYLMSNAHWSPFELVHLVIEFEVTRDIGRQVLRHTSFKFQEFSQRYADPTESLGFAYREARLQDPKNRQNSIDAKNDKLSAEFIARQKAAIDRAEEDYRWAIENGIAKEQARVFLPEGLTMSRMYVAGSLRSWFHYCQLRMGNGTQKEHVELAKAAWNLLVREFAFLREIRDLEK